MRSVGRCSTAEAGTVGGICIEQDTHVQSRYEAGSGLAGSCNRSSALPG